MTSIIDKADSEQVLRYDWNAQQSSYGTWYAIRGIVPSDEAFPMVATIAMHRFLLWPECVGRITDHKNRNGLDNRRSNLRVCTPVGNARNKGIASNNTSGYKGVHWAPNVSKWRAVIRVNSKLISLGHFATIRLAVLVYNAAAQEYFGEFACLNPVPETTVHNAESATQ